MHPAYLILLVLAWFNFIHSSLFCQELLYSENNVPDTRKTTSRIPDISKKTKDTGIKQKSYIHANPTHLLAGLMKCHCCGGAIVLVSGKNSGYYGCYNATRKTCNNKLLLSRKLVEQTVVSELKEKILTAGNLEYVYKNLERSIAKGLNEVPELIKKKKSQYDKALLEIQNYLNYIKTGNFSNAVSEA